MEPNTTVTAIRIFVVLITVAALIALVTRRLAIPYTVALVLAGLGAGLLLPATELSVTPELVLLVLLPGLVFEASFRIDLDELRSTIGGVLFLAAPGVIVAALVVAVALLVGTGMPLQYGFVVGAMVAATDPAAVISTFRRLGAPSRLSMLVEGESLFNDGTGLVVFAIALQALTAPVTVFDGLVAFFITVVASVAIGGVAGMLASRVVATVDDHLIEATITLATAYGTYLIADAVHESGVIATLVAGIVLGNYGRRIGMSARVQETIDTLWEFIGFLLTALVFMLVGLAIRLPQLVEALPEIAWGIVGILVGRALVVYLLLGGGSRVRATIRGGPPLSSAWLHVMFWAGLRGAVSVAMALSIPTDVPNRALLQEVTFGVVLFTLLVQGTTVDALAGRLLRQPGPNSEEAAYADVTGVPLPIKE